MMLFSAILIDGTGIDGYCLGRDRAEMEINALLKVDKTDLPHKETALIYVGVPLEVIYALFDAVGYLDMQKNKGNDTWLDVQFTKLIPKKEI